MARPLAWHGSAVKLARKTGREPADVDHFLHLAKSLLQDFSGLDRDQPAKRGFAGAQLSGKETDELASFWRRNRAPNPERRIRGLDRAIGIRRRVQFDLRDRRAIARRADDKAALVQGGFRNAELPHEVLDSGGVWGNGGVMDCHGNTRLADRAPITFSIAPAVSEGFA
jgi:hypothetical protein